ncbi:long-chain acyl-CoA synthetase [Nitrosospira sp. Nsp5]|uniref:Long-chain acyl-CoA synthetase n=1 Tax=Nitrosospira multiformis TaxID=1231 RepID=A0ABY0T6N0_9PROT|nr:MULTISPECIES: long-chain fatty acid--CoA ligase [Nitrosospira]PTR07148.1 long-chain acyl-CoA synthetase [Nitrosospira sp. Nsp5]SDQ34523.1 long-chain acyl-CoA synthetase [Nitrosospira multiformis]
MQNSQHDLNIIPVEVAGTLNGLFSERVRRSPEGVAYRDYDRSSGKWRDLTWEQMDQGILRWQAALSQENLVAGDRVAVMLRNCPEWVMFEHAALRMGLVVVPLYTADRVENAAYILSDAGVKVLLLEELAQWRAFSGLVHQVGDLTRVVTIQSSPEKVDDHRVLALHDWLPEQAGEIQSIKADPHQLATIIYTSGTSGRPKGVMLSHHNILTNAYGCSQIVPLSRGDLLLSFLPLSHAYERTGGYYVPMMCGATVAYARSIQQLPEDLLIIRPTILVSVPRIYERVYGGIRAKLAEGSAVSRKLFNLTVDIGFSRFEYQQRRDSWHLSHLLWPLLDSLVAKKVMAKLGGRLRGAMTGGAALSTDVSRIFIGLGLPLLQGYGMTESSPVVCSNTFDNNVPGTVGRPIPGVEVKLGENNALLIHGPNVMLGYWNDPEATKAVLTPDGWLNSGDIARIDENGGITITGRLKEIIVMSTGEKVPPADMEAAILRDPLFEQVMLIGEGRSYLSALVVLNSGHWEGLSGQYHLDRDWRNLAQDQKLEEILLEKITRQISEFPGYAKVYRVALAQEPWTIENGMLTPTLKLRRGRVLDRYKAEVGRLYEGH